MYFCTYRTESIHITCSESNFYRIIEHIVCVGIHPQCNGSVKGNGTLLDGCVNSTLTQQMKPAESYMTLAISSLFGISCPKD